MPKYILTLKKGEPHPIPTGFPKNIQQPQHPSRQKQGERIGPKLQILSEAMEHQRAILQHDVNGIDPEMVLIFEVVGNVTNFIKAAQRAGMEWLGDTDSLSEPDEYFYNIDKDGNKIEKPVNEKLYLTLTNSVALRQLLSLWQRYIRGDQNFPTGFAPFKDVFSQLKDIRKWDMRDRFIATNVIGVWKELLESRPEKIKFEIELWFRPTPQKRAEAEKIVRNIIAEYSGEIIKSSVHEEIAYHGLIAVCPAVEIQQMIDNLDNALVNAEQIMWIRASGQVCTESNIEETSEFEIELPEEPLAPPSIALLDGLPLANHSLLHDRLIINDVDEYEDLYPADKRFHGTTMASLIIYGDLANPIEPIREKVYVRPIMKPINSDAEGIPDDELFVDVLHRSIKEIVDSPELSSSIRIINLSIGNPNRPFFNALSPEAKMLDWLSQQHNLLFLVSSGNMIQNFYLDKKIGELKKLSYEDRQKLLYQYIWNEANNMRILSPSESINAVTVGAIHKDSVDAPQIPGSINPVFDGYPALYSCFGGGFERSIKPDCVNVGGRNFYSHFDIDTMDAVLSATRLKNSTGPGTKVAVPNNGRTGVAFTCGTSNATAISSRVCANLLRIVRSIPNLNLPQNYEAIAVKAMFIHSCNWGEMGRDMMDHYVPKIARKQRQETLKMIGYGYPEPNNYLVCTDQRVTLIGYGSICQNEQIEFSFPLPPCLVSQAVKKRLTITLAWFSPINPNGKNYRLAKLSFNAVNQDILAKTRTDADANYSKHGTVQHEIFEGKHASVFEDGDEFKMFIQCKKEEDLLEAVKFVTLVTLESAPETMLPIYNDVQARIMPQVQIGN